MCEETSQRPAQPRGCGGALKRIRHMPSGKADRPVYHGICCPFGIRGRLSGVMDLVHAGGICGPRQTPTLGPETNQGLVRSLAPLDFPFKCFSGTGTEETGDHCNNGRTVLDRGESLEFFDVRRFRVVAGDSILKRHSEMSSGKPSRPRHAPEFGRSKGDVFSFLNLPVWPELEFQTPEILRSLNEFADLFGTLVIKANTGGRCGSAHVERAPPLSALKRVPIAPHIPLNRSPGRFRASNSRTEPRSQRTHVERIDPVEANVGTGQHGEWCFSRVGKDERLDSFGPLCGWLPVDLNQGAIIDPTPCNKAVCRSVDFYKLRMRVAVDAFWPWLQDSAENRSKEIPNRSEGVRTKARVPGIKPCHETPDFRGVPAGVEPLFQSIP